MTTATMTTATMPTTTDRVTTTETPDTIETGRSLPAGHRVGRAGRHG
jgi:hypothetical protein